MIVDYIYMSLNWETLRPGSRDSTNNTRNTILKNIIGIFGELGLDLEKKETYTNHNLEAFLAAWSHFKDEKGYAKNTIINYATVLLVLANYFDGTPKLVRSLNAEVHNLQNETKNEGTHIKPFEMTLEAKEEILKRVELANYKHPQSKYNMKILAVIHTSGLSGLRFDDVVKTKTVDDPEWHYLDLENAMWHIRPQKTKNNRKREFAVPDDVIRAVKLYSQGPAAMNLVLSDRYGEPLTNLKSLSNQLKRVFGTTLGSIRKGSAQMAYDNAEAMSEIANHANVLGHTVETELVHYVEPEPEARYIVRKSDGRRFLISYA